LVFVLQLVPRVAIADNECRLLGISWAGPRRVRGAGATIAGVYGRTGKSPDLVILSWVT